MTRWPWRNNRRVVATGSIWIALSMYGMAPGYPALASGLAVASAGHDSAVRMTGSKVESSTASTAAPPGADAGEVSPERWNFELYALDGRLFSAGALRAAPGTRLLVVDFFSTECEPCKKAIPEWIGLYDVYHGRGLEVVIVAMRLQDSRDEAAGKLERFFAEKPVPFPVVFDKYSRVAERYGVTSGGTGRLPQAFVFDSAGKLVARGDGLEAVAGTIREVIK